MRRDSQVVPLVIIGVTATLFVLAAIVPARRRIATAQGETHKLQADILSESARLIALESVHRDVASLQARTANFDRRIPPEPELGDFLGKLTEIIERNGLRNHILQPRPAHRAEETRFKKTDAQFGEINVQPVLLQCEGRFEGLFGALADLERLPRLSEIDEFKVSADPARPGWIKVELLVNAFFCAPPAVERVGA